MSDSIGITRPPEPPDGTIVVDAYGKAWQRHDRDWYCAGDSVRDRRDWISVLLGFGPVTVLRMGSGGGS